MIEIVSTLALNSVQDLGRFGARHYGVSTSGVMDPLALAVANSLLGNPENAACIEVQTFPFRLRFLSDIAFAVTGAECRASLDDAVLPPWWATTARAGQVLALHPPTVGSRACVAFAGGVDVPVILGSRSTHLRSGFGGLEGRSLRTGDVVRILPSEVRPVAGVGAVPPEIVVPPCPSAPGDKALPLRVLRAGEYDIFPSAMQERFWQTAWKISHQSDRGGYRLSGPPLKLPAPVEMRSYGLVAGIVQVPPAGEPIIQLSDANTAGGYPKMAAVIEADIWRLAQARLGSTIRFVEVAYDDAVRAMEPIAAYLDSVRRSADLYRTL
ncbi:MAG: biotin-dependent carboxyltransferase family protein [Alphaproteobacteria bacterium]|nr:biotin-dependent carboxyltransferase family protein [Alphaproteobacteria bacterium]